MRRQSSALELIIKVSEAFTNQVLTTNPSQGFEESAVPFWNRVSIFKRHCALPSSKPQRRYLYVPSNSELYGDKTFDKKELVSGFSI